MAAQNFSVDSFKGQFGGGARPNLFKCYVQPPPAVGESKGAASSFEYVAQTASLPGETVGIIEQPYMGRVYKIPGNRTFEDWTTTVIVDEDFTIRAMFEDWSQLVGGNTTNRWATINLSSVYASDLSVIQYDRVGDGIREYAFMNAWPSTIGPIELGWDTNDAVETFDITWTYSWHETVDMPGAARRAWAAVNSAAKGKKVGSDADAPVAT